MLQFSEVTHKFGEKVIFESMSATVHAGQSVGIVGRNGAGKTTLFDLIQRKFEPEDGDITYPASWRIATMEQRELSVERAALEFVRDGHVALRQVERQLNDAESRGDLHAYGRLHTLYEDLGGYQIESRAAAALSGLGFQTSDFNKPYREFSGGWRIRLNLAKTLLTPSDLLLLDEPTNHLDLETTVWLQKWTQSYAGTLLIISHDREFLDKTTTHTLHLEQLRVFGYRGNYSSFEKQRTERLALAQALYVRQQKERARIQVFVDRFRYKASKARQVQSRIKMLERLDAVAPVPDASPYSFRIGNPTHRDQPTIALDKLQLGYDSSVVLSDVTVRIYPRDRIGILGLNGTGKTTLLKALAQLLVPQAGELRFSDHCSVGYFAQQQLELLQAKESPAEHLSGTEEIAEQTMRNYLGSWGFGGDDIFRPVQSFSGGEKARLVLALLARKNPAVLLLDEPTNHLDLEMRTALATALHEYEGAVLLVAHDQHLLRECVEEFWLVRDGTVSRFEGNLDDYETLLDEEKPAAPVDDRISKKALRRERAALRREEREASVRLAKLEREIETIQDEMDEVVAWLGDPDKANEVSTTNFREVTERYGRMQSQLADLEKEWSALVDDEPTTPDSRA